MAGRQTDPGNAGSWYMVNHSLCLIFNLCLSLFISFPVSHHLRLPSLFCHLSLSPCLSLALTHTFLPSIRADTQLMRFIAILSNVLSSSVSSLSSLYVQHIELSSIHVMIDQNKPLGVCGDISVCVVLSARRIDF